MLTHQLPPELARLDATDRENWAVAAALAIIQQTDPLVLATMVATGEDEFVRVARAGFAGQDFRTENLKSIFAILKYEVSRQPRHRPDLIHG